MRRMGEVESERKSLEEKSFEVAGETVRARNAELALRVLRREDIFEESVEGAILRMRDGRYRGANRRREIENQRVINITY